MDIVRKVLRMLGMVILSGVAALAVSCEKDENFGIKEEEGVYHPYIEQREAYVETRRVLIFYECGFNSLYSYIKKNMEKDLEACSTIPEGTRKDDVILVFSKLGTGHHDVPSYLRRVYIDRNGEYASDTLKTYPSSTIASSPTTMRDVLSYIKAAFPAKSYGMVFSSHGSGWLPVGYYYSPSAFERQYGSSGGRKMSGNLATMDVPVGNMKTDDPYAGMVRSLGEDAMSTGDVGMTVPEFVGAIPFHLDYLFFDMCFSGGMEIVYALRNKADYLGVSPAEVLADGIFDYTTLTDYLFKPGGADLHGLFEYSFKRYDDRRGAQERDGERSATVTLVRTAGLDNLASVVKDLVDTYSTALSRAPVNRIQGYFRMNRHYFYDLEDTFAKCGASEADLARLNQALNGCIVYKNATPSFLCEYDINTYSGFSIYLPCAGTSLLNSYFKNEEWNKATGFVK
ncbi:MAG: hypothetical protein IK076_02885 [Bacteroidales bacterium]|nr:hypothetical protein [Bacteroidales bacterium]